MSNANGRKRASLALSVLLLPLFFLAVSPLSAAAEGNDFPVSSSAFVIEETTADNQDSPSVQISVPPAPPNPEVAKNWTFDISSMLSLLSQIIRSVFAMLMNQISPFDCQPCTTDICPMICSSGTVGS
jgi:hypothetical protein